MWKVARQYDTYRVLQAVKLLSNLKNVGNYWAKNSWNHENFLKYDFLTAAYMEGQNSIICKAATSGYEQLYISEVWPFCVLKYAKFDFNHKPRIFFMVYFRIEKCET